MKLCFGRGFIYRVWQSVHLLGLVEISLYCAFKHRLLTTCMTLMKTYREESVLVKTREKNIAIHGKKYINISTKHSNTLITYSRISKKKQYIDKI